MQINTKFDIGSEAWAMKDNKPHKFTIFEIDITLTTAITRIILVERIPHYRGEGGDSYNYYTEEECTLNKEELFKMIFNEEQACG